MHDIGHFMLKEKSTLILIIPFEIGSDLKHEFSMLEQPQFSVQNSLNFRFIDRYLSIYYPDRAHSDSKGSNSQHS